MGSRAIKRINTKIYGIALIGGVKEMVEANLFLKLSGVDENDFAILFNDGMAVFNSSRAVLREQFKA